MPDLKVNPAHAQQSWTCTTSVLDSFRFISYAIDPRVDSDGPVALLCLCPAPPACDPLSPLTLLHVVNASAGQLHLPPMSLHFRFVASSSIFGLFHRVLSWIR
jgi:hypothetical protein